MSITSTIQTRYVATIDLGDGYTIIVNPDTKE